ncbi:hypothetical protein SC828_14610, partial [Legionella pneumophila serogroup 1]
LFQITILHGVFPFVDLFFRNNQQDTPPNLFFHTPDSSITLVTTGKTLIINACAGEQGKPLTQGQMLSIDLPE